MTQPLVHNLTLLLAFKLYPPKSNQDLRGLHKSIVESSGPDHHKISVLYYVLLDFDLPTGRRVYSGSFEKSSFLPAKYQIYMKGLWHLDRLDFEVCGALFSGFTATSDNKLMHFGRWHFSISHIPH